MNKYQKGLLLAAIDLQVNSLRRHGNSKPLFKEVADRQAQEYNKLRSIVEGLPDEDEASTGGKK